MMVANGGAEVWLIGGERGVPGLDPLVQVIMTHPTTRAELLPIYYAPADKRQSARQHSSHTSFPLRFPRFRRASCQVGTGCAALDEQERRAACS